MRDLQSMIRWRCCYTTYLSGGDHDTDLLDSLGKLIRLHSAVVVQVEVLESLEEDGLLVGGARGLLRQLLLKRLFEATRKKESIIQSQPLFTKKKPHHHSKSEPIAVDRQVKEPSRPA